MKKYITNRLVRGYDANLAAAVVVSTLVLVLRRYYPLDMGLPQGTALIYYVLIPLMSGLVLFRDRPSDYGIRIGHWKGVDSSCCSLSCSHGAGAVCGGADVFLSLILQHG